MKHRALLLLALGIVFVEVAGKGKTYDDLDDILKHEGLNSTKTHVQHQDPIGGGIDPNKVVRTKKISIQEEKAVTSGVVVPRGYQQSLKTRVSNRTYEDYIEKKVKSDSGRNDSGSIPFRYLKIPKHDKDAQFYFFLSTLLLLATTITIISSCGCLFYFLMKNLVGMQQRMLAGNSYPDDYGVQDQQNRPGSGLNMGVGKPNDRFQPFEDEEQHQQQPQREERKQQERLPRLNAKEQMKSSGGLTKQD